MNLIPLFPTPYPGELFYSLVARYADLMNFYSVQYVMDDLFDAVHYRPAVAFPTRLQQLVDRMPANSHITCDSLIDNHTLFPFYAPFHSVERRQSVRQAMAGSENVSLGFHLGIARSLTPPLTVFRYCPSCTQQDRETYGETYWHRLHHLPGVHICAEHNEWLLETNIAINNQNEIVHAENVIPEVIS